MSKNILVTGGLGFIGSHIVDALLDNGDKVVVLDNGFTANDAIERKPNFEPSPEERLEYYLRHHSDKLDLSKIDDAQAVMSDPLVHPLKGKNLTVYLGDIRDPRLIDLVNAHEIDVIDHHAAQVSVSYSQKNPVTDVDINVKGTANICDVCTKTDVKHLVVIGSGGTYVGDYLSHLGPQATPEELKASAKGEENHSQEQSVYGMSKIYCINLPRILGVDHTALGYMNVYGPRQESSGEAGVVAIWIEKMLKLQQEMKEGKTPDENDLPVINYNGQYTRDMMPWKLAVEANMNAIEKGPQNDFFIIGTGNSTNLLDLFQYCADAVGYTGGSVLNPDERPGDILHSLADVSKSRGVLSVSEDGGISLEDGIKEVEKYIRVDMQKHPGRY